MSLRSYHFLLGSDPGPFFLGRHGIYFHEPGVWFLAMVFSGNHVHRGTAPKTPPPGMVVVEEIPNDVQKVWHQAGRENRAMTVAYVSFAATKRTGSHSITPPAFFGNEGNLKAHKDMQRTFSEHGHVVLGNFRSRFNKLGSELIYQFYNSMRHVGFIFTGHSLDEIAHKFSYADEAGETLMLDGPPIDIIRDPDSIALYRGWWAWHSKQRMRHYTRVTKAEISEARLALQLRSKDTLSYALTEIRSMLPPHRRGPITQNSLALTSILARRINFHQVRCFDTRVTHLLIIFVL